MSAQYPQQPNGYTNQPKDSTLAIVSMVCGIGSYFFIPVVGAIPAIICGHLAKTKIKNSLGLIKGNGMATDGLVLGYIQIGLGILGVCIILVVLPILGASIMKMLTNMGGSFY
jgi:hypothetical protein